MGGYRAAQYLGLLLMNGKPGVPQNGAEAIKYFQFGAKAPGSEAAACMNNIGLCYENGIGVPRNLNLAISWYKTAISRGSTSARDNLVRLGVQY